MGVNLKLINLLNKYLLKNIKVGFTFLNIVNKKNLFLRLKKRKSLNRYDKFNSIFYNKVQNGFIKLANSKKKSYMIINSNLEIENNKKLILDKINKLI
jgi:dTMP kinase